MRLQSTHASCGPTALRNALSARGVARSEDELARLSGCTARGTSARGLLRAILAIAADVPELVPGVISERRADIALLRLLEALRAGSVAILCVDQWDHWVVGFGLLGRDTIHVSDSADTEMVLHYKPAQLLARWAPPGARGAYYGILL